MPNESLEQLLTGLSNVDLVAFGAFSSVDDVTSVHAACSVLGVDGNSRLCIAER